MVELITSGVELMLVGMGIVYTFLAMLIGAIYAMSGLIERFLPETPKAERPATKQAVDQSSIAAISAAVHQYRLKHK
jgi:oxaloacetate decarboxylase (Na+ extruding) subunit gamma